MKLEHFWNIKHIRDNKVIYEDNQVANTISNQGISAILNSFYRGNATPSIFWVRLCNYTPQVTDTLISLASYEPPVTNGYAPYKITADATTSGFPTSTSSGGSTLTITSAMATFTADGGNIGPVTTAYVATTGYIGTPPSITLDNTGILVSYLPLALTRTILNGDSMTYEFQVQLN